MITSTGTRKSEIAALDAQRKSEIRYGLRRVEWAAGRENIDDGHICEGKNKAKQSGHAHDGRHHGNDDLELRAPKAGPIHRGGLRNILGNGGPTRQQDHRSKWQQAPAMD